LLCIPLQEKPQFVERLFAVIRVFDHLEYLRFGLFRKFLFKLEILVEFAI